MKTKFKTSPETQEKTISKNKSFFEDLFRNENLRNNQNYVFSKEKFKKMINWSAKIELFRFWNQMYYFVNRKSAKEAIKLWKEYSDAFWGLFFVYFFVYSFVGLVLSDSWIIFFIFISIAVFSYVLRKKIRELINNYFYVFIIIFILLFFITYKRYPEIFAFFLMIFTPIFVYLFFKKSKNNNVIFIKTREGIYYKYFYK